MFIYVWVDWVLGSVSQVELGVSRLGEGRCPSWMGSCLGWCVPVVLWHVNGRSCGHNTTTRRGRSVWGASTEWHCLSIFGGLSGVGNSAMYVTWYLWVLACVTFFQSIYVDWDSLGYFGPFLFWFIWVGFFLGPSQPSMEGNGHSPLGWSTPWHRVQWKGVILVFAWPSLLLL